MTLRLGGVAIGAVIFDMDGLLLDTEPVALRAWEHAARELAIEFDLGLCRQMIGRNFRDCSALIRARYGDDYPVERLTQTWGASYDAIIADEGVSLKPGIHVLLDLLEERMIAAAVATSTRRERASAKLQNAGLMHRFAVLVGGDEVQAGKPAPDTFLLAAKRLGVAAARCVVLEDSEPGVMAAWAADMMPIMIPDLHPPSAALLARDPMVMASLADVARHLAGTTSKRSHG